MIDTISKIKVYEIDGKETPMGAENAVIDVRSVSPYTERVAIVVDGHRYVVVRRDLEAALAATAHTGAR